MGIDPFADNRRIERTLTLLRAFVLACAALHVWVAADHLAIAGVSSSASGALWLGLANTLLLAWVWVRVVPSGALRAFGFAGALVDTAWIGVLISATLSTAGSNAAVWMFALWVPFSLAFRFPPVWAILGAGVAAAMTGAIAHSSLGPLESIPWSWEGLGLPLAGMVAVAITASISFLCEHRSARQVQSALDVATNHSMQLRESDELKNTFLAAVSHELRTPLTSILGFAVTLLDRQDLPPAQRDEMLRTVVVEAEHLEDILGNMLDLDRLTRGKVTLVPSEVDLCQLVERAVDHVRRRSLREIAVRVGSESIDVNLDAAKVERIVENLVSNAVKYTPASADIDVSLIRDDRGVTLRVDDGGPGLAPDLHATVFEPFQRGADRGVPGTGIGLSLVDQFSRMHGGRAWVEERPGGGCRFQVYLPAPRSAEPSIAPDITDIAGTSVDHAPIVRVRREASPEGAID